ncbi:MAG TPA: methyltransferase [Thermodesulfobacteriota bacterium]|nr:methyltransferase [Thermodesulfobacteriota bacterium]
MWDNTIEKRTFPVCLKMNVTAAEENRDKLMEMIHGNWLAQCIYVAAKLGIADHLKEGPKSSDELSHIIGAEPRALYRLLRALSGLGVFHEEPGKRFSLTAMGELLGRESPNSLNAYIIMINEKECYQSWGNLLYSVKTGGSSFEHVFGQEFLQYVEKKAEFAGVFNQAMVEKYRGVIPSILKTYDFSGFNTVVDVGGGYGQLLIEILKSNPNTRGILFDLPKVIEGAGENIANSGVGERITLIAGDCFDKIPEGGDGYVLKSFINNWEDEDAVKVLSNCRRSMNPDGKLIIIEPVLLPANEPDYGKLMDLQLLVLQKSRERTREDFEGLLKLSGFSMRSIFRSQSEFSIIEAVPVG